MKNSLTCTQEWREKQLPQISFILLQRFMVFSSVGPVSLHVGYILESPGEPLKELGSRLNHRNSDWLGWAWAWVFWETLQLIWMCGQVWEPLMWSGRNGGLMAAALSECQGLVSGGSLVALYGIWDVHFAFHLVALAEILNQQENPIWHSICCHFPESPWPSCLCQHLLPYKEGSQRELQVTFTKTAQEAQTIR